MNSEPGASNDALAASPVASKPSSPLPEKAKKATKNLYDPYIIPRPLYEFIRCLIAVPILLLVSRIYLKGRHNVPKHGAYLIAANHLAWTDIPLVPLFLPRKVIYMAKEEYFTSKIAWLVRLLGAFPVKRGEGDRQALRTADDQLKKGNVVVLFPEGTRSKTRTLAKAHAGLGMIALRSGVPVVPVAIWGSENILKQFRPRVTISYGEPMVFKPKGAKMTREDIDNATEEVMRAIAAMLPPEYRGVYKEQQIML